MKVVDGPCTMPAWSPDGNKFAFQVRDGDYSAIWTIDAKTLANLNSRLQSAPAPAKESLGDTQSGLKM